MQEVLLRPLPKGLRKPAAGAPAAEKTGDSITLVSRLAVGLVLIGGGMQGYANSTIGAVPVALIFLAAGSLVITLTFRGKRPELRAFLLAYSVSILVGGLSQCYSLYIFADVNNFSDAVYFFNQISPHPPFRQWSELPTDTVLAVFTWQQLYRICWYLDLSFGPYVAVMFNAMLIGLSGSLTVATARELFGDDTRRLRRAEILFAACGLFILFGAVMIRDSFIVFFNVLWLFGIVRWLVRPSSRSLAGAVAVTCIALYAMLNLREELVMLFGVYLFLAALTWYCVKKLNATRIIVVCMLLAVTPVADTYVTGFLREFRDTQRAGQQNYSTLGGVESSGSSLGTRFIENQPLPVRMVLSTGTLLINPIPLWNNFKADNSEYHLLEGYHGIYLVLIIPLGLVGLLGIARLMREQGRKAIPWIFLAAYVVVNLAAVAASSKLPRHLGQFLTGMVILAALPDPRDKAERKRLRLISIGWFGGVVLVHVAWAVLR
jgi:hypothetical protein